MFLPPLIRSVRTAAAWETAEYSGEKKKEEENIRRNNPALPRRREQYLHLFPNWSCGSVFFFFFFLPLQLSGCRTQPRGGDIDGARVSPHFRTLHQKYFCLRRATRHLAGDVTATAPRTFQPQSRTRCSNSSCRALSSPRPSELITRPPNVF